METTHSKLEIENPEINLSMQNIVKNNLEIIILSMLSEKAMCGYDLIKDIFTEYNVYLSQGTLYPCLYNLKEKGIVQAKHSKNNMRTKRYFITSEGKRIVDNKIDAFIEAEIHVMNLIRKKS